MRTTKDIFRFASLAALLLAGSCAAPTNDGTSGFTDPTLNHPNSVEPSYHSIKLPFSANDAGLLRADMALGSGRADAGALYQSQHGPASDAGAGLAALAREDKAGARKSFEAAIAQGAKSARAYLEIGILLTVVTKNHTYLTRDITMNRR